MDIEKITALIQLMNENDLTEVEIEREGEKIRLKKAGNEVKQEVIAIPTSMGDRIITEPQAAAAAAEQKKSEELVEIISPMVGTFYKSGSPDSDAFVQTGDVVEEETVVCIIEAMKVMNEIKAEVHGRVAEVLVKNGEAVEYGQVLFRVKPIAGAESPPAQTATASSTAATTNNE